MLVRIVLHVHPMPVIQEFELIEINSFIHGRISYKHAGFHYISYILQLKRGVCGHMHLPDAEAGGHPHFLKKTKKGCVGGIINYPKLPTCVPLSRTEASVTLLQVRLHN